MTATAYTTKVGRRTVTHWRFTNTHVTHCTACGDLITPPLDRICGRCDTARNRQRWEHEEKTR